MARSKVKSRSHYDVARLLLPTNILTKYQLPIPYNFLDIAQKRFYRSKVESRSHPDVANLQPPTNVPTKYQLPTPYNFGNIARTRFYR